MVISHCGANGHRGMHVMESHLRKFFAISGLVNRIRTFCQKCLLCLHVKGGAIIPRPFSPTYHTHERNQALHWDYLSLGDSFGSARYVLVLKDEATQFVDLVACDRRTAEVAVAATLDWYSRFGIASVWIRDSGSRFKNQVVAELNKRLKARQEFILAYSPWKNGTIERVNRDITQVLKALTLEFRVSRHDWSYLLPLVQSSINHSSAQSLANHAPIELFTGLPCPSSLDSVLFPGRKEGLATLPKERCDIEQRLERLRNSIKDMHKDVEVQRSKHQRRYRNRYHYERPVDFSVGDYVLRSRVDEKLHSIKLLVTWVGPYRVTGSSDYYFTVEHLVTGKALNVHPSRLKMHADDSLQVTAELLEQVSSQGTLLTVDELIGHKYNADMKSYEIQVKWKGLEEIEASWEPLNNMTEDVPQLLNQYVEKVADERLRSAALRRMQRKKSWR